MRRPYKTGMNARIPHDSDLILMVAFAANFRPSRSGHIYHNPRPLSGARLSQVIRFFAIWEIVHMLLAPLNFRDLGPTAIVRGRYSSVAHRRDDYISSFC